MFVGAYTSLRVIIWE